MGSCEFEIRLNCLHEHQYQNTLEYQTQTTSNFTIFWEYENPHSIFHFVLVIECLGPDTISIAPIQGIFTCKNHSYTLLILCQIWHLHGNKTNRNKKQGFHGYFCAVLEDSETG